jgi:hypothetical protein
MHLLAGRSRQQESACRPVVIRRTALPRKTNAARPKGRAAFTSNIRQKGPSPTAVSASAEAEGYARPAITIPAAIVWPTISAAIVPARSVAVAFIIRAVVTTSIVSIVSTLRADVGR